MAKKCIVLSGIDNSNKKAVLTLEEKNEGIIGSLRLYNFAKEIDGIASLGIYANNKVYKSGLTLKSNMFYEFLVDIKEIPNKFSCAVVNIQNAEAKPILYGSSEGNEDDIYGEIISEISSNATIFTTQTLLDKYDIDYDENEKAEIEKEIDTAMCCDNSNCANCVYKKYFFEHQEKENSQEEKKVAYKSDEIKENQKDEDLPFYSKLKNQIDKLFEKNPPENSLANLIPSSKWVKVEYEDEGDFYVFGLLYDENGNVKYVCYGVPAVYEENAPKELSGYPIWTPLDKENAKGFGYWLTYQDASSGEPIKVIVN